MHGAKEILLKQIKTLLYNQIIVSDETVQYYVGYFGDKTSGIYLQSYRGDNASNKHTEGELATFELVVFGKDKTVDFVSEASRKVKGKLKASVHSTLSLGNRYQATYTDVKSTFSETFSTDGVLEHRDTITFEVMINETTNES